jgi:hypothetical protein
MMKWDVDPVFRNVCVSFTHFSYFSLMLLFHLWPSEMPHLEELDVSQSSSFDDTLVEAFCCGHDRWRSRLRVFKVRLILHCR